MVLLVGAVKNS